MSLQLTLTASLDGTMTADNTPVGVAVSGVIHEKLVLQFGSNEPVPAGDVSVDAVYTEALNISVGGGGILDMRQLTDPLGLPLNFEHIKAVMVLAAPANANDIVLGPGEEIGRA